ncbi:hypothetical protein [Parapedobacter sp. 10938]|uniref:hypothetical protein n=1 Tax=Parapedobacter flavus TaxID=3110225 RepID=UPI002DBFD692|nr:hypothetical protein [Parapedobacter sp. 10938]MEC3879712.1 hypothetical protein [Parapedobacter sp. 10938]
MAIARRVFFLSAALLSFVATRAQDVGWDVRFHGFADNREYAHSGRYSQSILGIRIAPEVYFSIDSSHFLHAGINYLHEFGSHGRKADRISPTVYYNYKHRGHQFYIGMFPREGLLSGYHKAILNDTLQYYRPNIEGLLWRYGRHKFHQQVWIDWTSRQTAIDREQFLAGMSGYVGMGMAYFSHQITLWHNARSKGGAGTDPTPIRDNGAAMVKLGADLTPIVFLDSLDISGGGLIAYDRLRGVYDWRTPKGIIAELYAEYRKFFVANRFYAGESLPIVYGDRFYTASRYNRLDLGWTPLQYKGLEGRFTLSLHFTPGALDNQQQFTLRYRVGRLYVKQR